MRQTRRTPPSREPAGRLPGLLTNAGASRARVGGRPRRRCTQSTPSAPPREVNNPSRSKALGNRCTVTLWPLTPVTRSHRFGAIPPRPGSSATSTGPCRPSLKTPSSPSRRESPDSSQSWPGATPSWLSSRVAQSPSSQPTCPHRFCWRGCAAWKRSATANCRSTPKRSGGARWSARRAPGRDHGGEGLPGRRGQRLPGAGPEQQREQHPWSRLCTGRLTAPGLTFPGALSR